MRGLAIFGEKLKERLEHPGAAQPPEPLPYAVPFAKFRRQGPPRDAMDSEIVHRFQKFPVVMPRLATARLGRVKNLQHHRPILFRHSRQHARPSVAGHAVIRTIPDSGIRQILISGVQSTRPKSVIVDVTGRVARPVLARHATALCRRYMAYFSTAAYNQL